MHKRRDEVASVDKELRKATNYDENLCVHIHVAVQQHKYVYLCLLFVGMAVKYLFRSRWAAGIRHDRNIAEFIQTSATEKLKEEQRDQQKN